MNPGPLQLWDRRADEPLVPYHWFCVYRDAGPTRGIRKLAAEAGAPSVFTMFKWSPLYNWAERAEAWDIWRDHERRIETKQQIEAMRRRHAAIGAGVAAKAWERINAINPNTLTVREAILLLSAGVKIERLSRGEPSDAVAITTSSGAATPILDLLRRSPRLLELADAVEEELALSAEE